MALEESASLFGMDAGCEVHGEERMRECVMCGVEFCALCHPGRRMCPDCAEPPAEDLEDEDDGAAAPDDDLLGYDDLLDDEEDEAEDDRDGD